MIAMIIFRSQQVTTIDQTNTVAGIPNYHAYPLITSST